MHGRSARAPTTHENRREHGGDQEHARAPGCHRPSPPAAPTLWSSLLLCSVGGAVVRQDDNDGDKGAIISGGRRQRYSLTSDNASEIRFTCLVRQAKPPNDRGLCMPLRTQQEGGGSRVGGRDANQGVFRGTQRRERARERE